MTRNDRTDGGDGGEECDPIIEAGDDGVILADGDGPTVRCPNGHTFDRDEAAAATFDGDEARYVCPNCGRAVEGPPPG